MLTWDGAMWSHVITLGRRRNIRFVSLEMGKAGEMETEDLATGGGSGGCQSAAAGDAPAFQVATWGQGLTSGNTR